MKILCNLIFILISIMALLELLKIPENRIWIPLALGIATGKSIINILEGAEDKLKTFKQ